MKKIICLVLGCFIIGSFMLLAVEKVKEQQKPEVKELAGFFVAHSDYSGSYKEMSQKIPKFVEEFMKQGMIPMGNAISIYYNSPEEVKEENLKWGFGFVVPKESKVKDSIKLREFKKHRAVVYLHKGPYKHLQKSWEIAWKYVKEKGYKVTWPVYDRYLNNPQMAKPEDLKTQIVLPIE
jgi:effector-binding domain-containing protein